MTDIKTNQEQREQDLEKVRKILAMHGGDNLPVPARQVIDGWYVLAKEGHSTSISYLLDHVLHCHPAKDDRPEQERYLYLVDRYYEVLDHLQRRVRDDQAA